MSTAAVRSLVFWALTIFIAAEVKDTPIGPAFSCRGRSPGYYADLETNCQDYHMCDAGGRRYTYSCPNQTRFQQRVMICDHWFLVDCSLSESHFDANLLIGQKDKHFVESLQREDSVNSGDSFRPIPSPPPRRNYSQTQAVNEIKKSVRPPPTRKETVKYAETKFTTPTGAIKPTTERSLPREFANNPFFSSLTQAPTSVAGKGERGSVTFHQRKDQAVSPVANLSHKPLSTSTPPPSTPPARPATPPLRNFPLFPNNEQRRPSTLPATTPPSTSDHGFVTREGHSNQLTQRTEPPRLFRNDFSKVIEITSFGAFTTTSPLTTQRELTQTRERVDLRAPLPLTRAPPTPSLAPSNWAPPTPATRPNRTQSSSYEVGFRPLNASQGYAGLLRTPGGFRYETQDIVSAHDRRPTAFGVQGPTGTGFSSEAKFTSSPDSTRRGAFSTGFDVSTERELPTGPGISTGKGFPSGPYVSTGKDFTSRGSFSTGKDYTTGANVSTGKSFPSGTGISTGKDFTSRGSFSTGKDFTTGADVSTGKGFPSGPDISSGKGFISGTKFSNGKDFATGADVSTKSDLPSGFGSAPPSGSDVSTGDNVPTGPDGSLEDRFPSGPGASFEELGSSPGEEEEDFNTVEVRIPDPRRMFFIPDNAASEAEMLNSTNETVLRIPLPSSRHHGPMRFKGVRGAKGRRSDCPQCHPAFLVPGTCQPCVLIRR